MVFKEVMEVDEVIEQDDVWQVGQAIYDVWEENGEKGNGICRLIGHIRIFLKNVGDRILKSSKVVCLSIILGKDDWLLIIFIILDINRDEATNVRSYGVNLWGRLPLFNLLTFVIVVVDVKVLQNG